MPDVGGQDACSKTLHSIFVRISSDPTVRRGGPTSSPFGKHNIGRMPTGPKGILFLPRVVAHFTPHTLLCYYCVQATSRKYWFCSMTSLSPRIRKTSSLYRSAHSNVVKLL